MEGYNLLFFRKSSQAEDEKSGNRQLVEDCGGF